MRRAVLTRTGGLAAALALPGLGPGPCSSPRETPGSSDRPLRLMLGPAADPAGTIGRGQPLGDLLAKEIGATVEVRAPDSYAAALNVIAGGEADLFWLSPVAYSVARSKYGVEVLASGVRHGSKTHRGQLIAHAGSGIKTVADLKGKRFAVPDTASPAGFLYPLSAIKEMAGSDVFTYLGQVQQAGGHDKVVVAIYQRQVDGGATFGTSSPGGPETDARTLVSSTLPDVGARVVRIGETEPIPNEAMAVRKGLPKELVDTLRAALPKVASAPEGKKHLLDLYGVEGLADATDAEYAAVRRKAEQLGVSLETALKQAPTAGRTPL